MTKSNESHNSFARFWILGLLFFSCVGYSGAESSRDQLEARAFSAESSGNFKVAARYYRYLRMQYPQSPEYPHHIAVILAKQGETNKSLMALQESLSIDASYVPALLMHANRVRAQGSAREAIALYERILDIDASQREAVSALITLHESLGDHGKVEYYASMLD